MITVLDSSAGDQLANNTLKKGGLLKLKNFIYINFAHLFSHQKVIGLNPLDCPPSLEDAVVTRVFYSLMVLFGSRPEETPMISKFLPALLHLLIKAKCTLYELIYFTDFHNWLYAKKREVIFDCSPQYDHYRLMVEEVFRNEYLFNEIRSTLRRIEPLLNGILSLSLAKTGIDWVQIVRDKIPVVVALGTFHLPSLVRRFVGSLVLNMSILAMDRLKENGWNGVRYFYIDEAGEYCTRDVADTLAYRRKTGVRMILANQYLDQFEDPYVQRAVLNLTKTKVAFFTPNSEDRMKITKAMYGGGLNDRDVAWVLSQQKKQHAVIKKGKEPAKIIKIPNVPDPEISQEELDAYLTQIYQQPFYFSPKEIRHEVNNRLPINQHEGDDSVSSRQRSVSDRASTSSSSGNRKTEHGSKRSDRAKKRRASGEATGRRIHSGFLEIEKKKDEHK